MGLGSDIAKKAAEKLANRNFKKEDPPLPEDELLEEWDIWVGGIMVDGWDLMVCNDGFVLWSEQQQRWYTKRNNKVYYRNLEDA